MADVSFDDAAAELARRDPVMARLIRRVGPCTLRPPLPDHFTALARAIVYQQLAGKAAAAIYARFEALFDGAPAPHAVLSAPDETLRAAGLSAAKTASIRDLAGHVADRSVPLDDVTHLPDDEIISRLSAVRGIGTWTAQMFLIFQLRRPDVWPVDDYGVRKGYAAAYDLPQAPSPRELAALGEPYRPFRTAAAWYCWRAVDVALMGDGAR